MHHLADTIDAALRHSSPCRSKSASADVRLRRRSSPSPSPDQGCRSTDFLRSISVCCKRIANVKPIQNRRFCYSRVGQNSAQTRATVGESGHFGGVGPAHGLISSVRWISTVISVSALATAPKTWRPPVSVSMLPAWTTKCLPPSSQLRKKVESKLIVIAAAAIGGFSAAASLSCWPTCSVWRRNVSGLFPTSIGRGTAARQPQPDTASMQTTGLAVDPARVSTGSAMAD
jgi:hypothetical protein